MRESRAVAQRKTKRRRGLFLTFEGIEGAGKSTQATRAAEWLASRGHAVLATREPGGTRLGKELRQVLLHSEGALDPGSELLLMVADRRQHVVESIEPALEKGTIVVCDRFTDASRAYQGAGRGLGEAFVDRLHRSFAIPSPDRTYLFDCPVALALSRLAGRAGGPDRFERERLAFHRRVRSSYLSRARKEPRRFLVLDASRSSDVVFQRMTKDLEALLERRAV